MEGRIEMPGVSASMREIVFDPQTSGGRLIAVAPVAARDLCDEIKKDDPAAAIIGEVVEREDVPVLVV
jgi:selenide,water dikinase